MPRSLFLLVIVGLLSLPVHAQRPPKETQEKVLTSVEAIEKVRPSVVQIFVRAGMETVVLGTGFIVSDEGHIITAHHVVDTKEVTIVGRDENGNIRANRIPITVGQMKIGVAMPDVIPRQPGGVTIRQSFKVYPFSVVDLDARHDVALLKCNDNPIGSTPVYKFKDKEVFLNVKSAMLSRDRPKDGDQITISGYPLQIRTLISTGGIIATSSQIQTQEIPVSPQPPNIPWLITRPDSMDIYLGDITANHGNSGGPVYFTRNGEIMGILVGGHENNGTYLGLAIIIPIKYAEDLLKKNKIALR